eukprot:EG_transcript_15896
MGNDQGTEFRAVKQIRTPGETPWQKDDEAPACMGCGVGFGFFTRRHHCRICGLVFCQNCSSQAVHGDRACQICFRKVMQALSEECLKNDNPDSLRAAELLPKAFPNVQREKHKSSEGKPAVFIVSLSKKTGARLTHRCPQAHRPSAGRHPVVQPPKAGAPFGCSPTCLSPNTSIASEDVTLGDSAAASSRNHTPAVAVEEVVVDAFEASRRKTLTSLPSEDELEMIYNRFLEKEHSHRTTKLIFDNFVQFDIPLPSSLMKQYNRHLNAL